MKFLPGFISSCMLAAALYSCNDSELTDSTAPLYCTSPTYGTLTIEGRVTDAQGAPCPNARITARQIVGEGLSVVINRDTTNERGEYALSEYVNGPAIVRVICRDADGVDADSTEIEIDFNRSDDFSDSNGEGHKLPNGHYTANINFTL